MWTSTIVIDWWCRPPLFCDPAMKAEFGAAAAASVIPTEVEGSRAVCGTQPRFSRPVGRVRTCGGLSMRPEARRDPSTTLGMTDGFPSFREDPGD